MKHRDGSKIPRSQNSVVLFSTNYFLIYKELPLSQLRLGITLFFLFSFLFLLYGNGSAFSDETALFHKRESPGTSRVTDQCVLSFVRLWGPEHDFRLEQIWLLDLSPGEKQGQSAESLHLPTK